MMSVAKEDGNALACEEGGREGGCGGQQMKAESEGRR